MTEQIELIRSSSKPKRTFPRRVRLANRKEFQKVFSKAKKVSGRYFTVLGAMGDDKTPKLGLAIAKKNVPLAIGRNRVKRLIRESFRNHQDNFGSIEVVVLAKREANNGANESLMKELNQLWQKIHRYFSA